MESDLNAGRPRVGKYRSFAELSQGEVVGRDYRIYALERPNSPFLIVAPHGGLIEVGTSEIATVVAGAEHSLYSFEGLKPYGANRELHITSHEFDPPDCLALAARCETLISIHGCLGDTCIHVGGLDDELRRGLAEHLSSEGFPVEPNSARYPGRRLDNICNRGRSGRGAQIEVTYDLRSGKDRAAIARAIRSAIAARWATSAA